MKKENIALILSIIAIAISIVALGCSHPRVSEYNFDYLGILIGILSLLVCILALLFGYNIIEFKRIVNKEINNKLKDFEQRSTQSIVDIQYTSLIRQAGIFRKAGDSGGFFINMANAIHFSSLVKDICKIESCVEIIHDALNFKETEEGESFNACGEDDSLDELKNALLNCAGYNNNAKNLLDRIYYWRMNHEKDEEYAPPV